MVNMGEGDSAKGNIQVVIVNIEINLTDIRWGLKQVGLLAIQEIDELQRET
ncbi:hypothetical protein [Peribacillus simplex]|uniref:hypothetical protein n=1 Tax=Peribacillus simplex TaxID=1478 RepID=UPI0028536518|nr:hypothetical protein [Peribacillus simplex]MDR4927912.1 hypothetical protein [Peribacillus simplex]